MTDKTPFSFIKEMDFCNPIFNCSSSELKFVGDSFEEYGVNRLYDFKNCDAGKEVRYLRLENIGHGVTRSYSILFDEVWKFFKKF